MLPAVSVFTVTHPRLRFHPGPPDERNNTDRFQDGVGEVQPCLTEPCKVVVELAHCGWTLTDPNWSKRQ